jgi:hypothetical protein
MAKKRVTVNIAVILADVNRKNQLSTCSPEVRAGWNSLLESILFAANLYIGFGYLYAKDVPIGQKAGITSRAPDGADLGKNVFPDESRRVYYVDAPIQAAYRELWHSESFAQQVQPEERERLGLNQ